MKSITKNQKNYCLDFIKGIACICVVFMHCEFPGSLGKIIQCVSRFCVPFFFMVSGYFCYYEDGRKTDCSKKIRHILKITLIAVAFYVGFGIFEGIIGNDIKLPSMQALFYFFIFNQPVFIVGQLWFLFALLYDYILFAIVDKFRLYKLAYLLIPVLICCYILLAQVAHIIGISVPNMVYRNFLIEGFSLFMLGHFIHKYINSIKIENSILLGSILISTILCLGERALLGRDFGVNICTFVQVTAIFLYGIKNHEKFSENIITYIGTKYSMLVYILHPFVWHMLEYIYKYYNLDQQIVALYVMPILVVFFTLALAKMCLKIKKVIKLA